MAREKKANVKPNFNENSSLQYKDVEFLKACDIDTWKQERDNVHVITSFEFYLREKDLSTISLAEKTNVVYAVKHLYSLVGNNIIMPFFFSIYLVFINLLYVYQYNRLRHVLSS